MAHAVALLDRSMSATLRHCILGLVRALLIPRAAGSAQQAAAAAKANGVAFIEAGGVQLMADFLAGTPVSIQWWFSSEEVTAPKSVALL